MTNGNGLSLLELLMTLSVLAILLVVGSGPFAAIIANARLVDESNRLVRAVHLAKTEAAKNFGEVVICPSRSLIQCQAQDAHAWQTGWLVFLNQDEDAPARVDDNERVLAAHRVHPQVILQSNRSAYVFHHYAVRSTNGTVKVCDKTRRQPARAVVISYTGRPRIAHRRSNGQPYRCER